MVEATHLQSMKSSSACQLLWLQYSAMHRQDVVMNLVFPPYKCDTFPGKKHHREMGFISLKRRTRRKASGVKQELRDKGRERHAIKKCDRYAKKAQDGGEQFSTKMMSYIQLAFEIRKYFFFQNQETNKQNLW